MQLAMGLVDLLLIHDPDRFSRRYAYQVLLLEEFQRWGVEVRFVKQPPPDSPEQQLLVQIQGAVAEYERARIMERTRRGRLYWARQGRPVSSQVPFGYRFQRRRDLNEPPSVEVDETEAEVLREIFRLYVEENWPVRQIVIHLTEQGVPTPTGKSTDWDYTSVRFILQSEAYLGSWFLNRYRTQHDPGGGRPRTLERPREEWIPISVPILVDAEQFSKAQEIRKQRQQSNYRPFRYHDTHLLRRLVVCGSCDKKMAAANSKHGDRTYRYYWCRGSDPHRIQKRRSFCPHPTIQAPPLDVLVWSDVVSLLTDPDLLLTAWQQQGKRTLLTEDVVSEEKRQVKQQLAAVRQQHQRLLVAYEQEAIELEELSCRRKVLEEKAQQLQRRLQTLDNEYREGIALSELSGHLDEVCRKLATGLEEMNMQQRMKLCSQLIDKVIVDRHSAEVHYKFPVSGNCNRGGEAAHLELQTERHLPILRRQTRRCLCCFSQ